MFTTIKEKAASFWTAYRSKKRYWLLTIIVIIIVIIVVGGSNASDDTLQATAERTAVVDTVVLSGRTQSASAVELGFADQGRIASVGVVEGDKVHAGQVLATLESGDLYADLKSAQASLVLARAQQTTTNTSIDRVTREQDALVDNAYRALLSNDLEAVPQSTSTSAPAPVITGSYTGPEGEYVVHVLGSSDINAQSFYVTGLENDVSNTAVPNQAVTLGTRGLFVQFERSGLYPNTVWTVAIPNKRSTTYATKYNAYLQAKAARDVAVQNAQAQAGVGLNDQSIIQAKIDQAQAQVDSILSRINKRRIVAPFDGVVSNITIKPGQSTSVETKNTITLLSQNDYEVILKVPEISVAKLVVGQPVDVTLDAYGKEVVFPGKITSINPAETIVDGVPVYETKVVFEHNDERIRSGMTASAAIVAARKDGVVAIPADMITTTEEGSFVSVLVDDKKTERRQVVTGLRGSDSKVEIVSGLTEGERVTAAK